MEVLTQKKSIITKEEDRLIALARKGDYFAKKKLEDHGVCDMKIHDASPVGSYFK